MSYLHQPFIFTLHSAQSTFQASKGYQTHTVMTEAGPPNLSSLGEEFRRFLVRTDALLEWAILSQQCQDIDETNFNVSEPSKGYSDTTPSKMCGRLTWR